MTPAEHRPRLLQALLDEAAEPLLGLDPAGTIRAANGAAAGLLGRRRGHLVGKPLAIFVELGDRRRFRTALGSLTQDRPVQTLEVAVATATESSPRRLDLRRLDGDGHVTAVLRAGPPPTPAPAPARRPSLERALARLPLGFVRLDASGAVLSGNGAAARALEPLGALREALREPPLARHVQRLLAHGGGPLLPVLVELPGGRVLRLSGSGARGDEPALLVLDDVTQFVRQTRAQETFVRNAAHQLRTPVTGISSALEVLQAGAKHDPQERDRFLAHVQRQTERLARLTRALLVLARVQSGMQAPRLEFVDVARLLERVAAELPHGEAVLVETSSPAGLAAFVEPDLLDETLRALAENALRHTRDGRVVLRAWRCDERRLEIEVADDGEGILPEHLDRILEPFFQPFSDGSGFGLGLSIAEQAVRAMGGELLVASKPQAGTRVVVRVPAADLVAT